MERVNFYFQDTKRISLNKSCIRDLIRKVIEDEGFQGGQVNLVFCSDVYLIDLNRKHLKHDYFTDIITFDYSEGKNISGELFIGIETVMANSEEYMCSFEDELKRVIIHGLLHMMGFDDKEKVKSDEMRLKEDLLLEKFREVKILR